MRTARSVVLAPIFAALLLCVPPAKADAEYLARAEVRSFIESMHLEHGLEREALERILGEARRQPAVMRLIGPERPTTLQPVRSYPAYRAKFLTKPRIAAGARFWEIHHEHLTRAEDEFGVPAEVILGILGVETAFGQNTGSFRIVDALTTIAFDGPRRQEYFREELKELLLLAHETGVDPLTIKGSYAGAMESSISPAARPTRSAASQAISGHSDGSRARRRLCLCDCLRAVKQTWLQACSASTASTC
jgi:membrane-bound lytic murein transglycosylase B